MARGLTLKQEKFVEAYLRLQNGGKAYKEAYGDVMDNTAYTEAWKNLRKPKIQDVIKQRKEQLEALNPVCTNEELAEGWSDDIRLDMGELVDEHGTFRSPKDLPRKLRRLLQGVKIKESIVEEEGGAKTVLNRWIEYKLPDRQKARIELGKRIGFYPAERIEHSGTVVTKMELTDEDRAIAKRLIDESVKLLMKGEDEKPS